MRPEGFQPETAYTDFEFFDEINCEYTQASMFFLRNIVWPSQKATTEPDEWLEDGELLVDD